MPVTNVYKKGDEFNGIKFIKEIERKNKRQRRAKWECHCGKVFETDITLVKSGQTKSCGCSHNGNKGGLKHGLAYTKIRNIFTNMSQRCYNKNNPRYKYYGERDIVICDEWKDNFIAFNDWAKDNGYKEGLSIERKDNSKGYNPDNCEWIEIKHQAYNKTNQTLSFAKAEEIREIKRLNPEMSNKKIGEIYGVAKTTIGAIIRGTAWRPEKERK